MSDGYGHNDADGNLFCHLCEWTKACGRNIEQIEAHLRRHLQEAHGRSLLYRVEDESGRKIDIP